MMRSIIMNRAKESSLLMSHHGRPLFLAIIRRGDVTDMLTCESNSQRTVLFAIKITFGRLPPHNECIESFLKPQEWVSFQPAGNALCKRQE